MSDRIDSEKLLVRDVFAKWYRIPEYQRPYVWGSDQITELLDDVSQAQNSNPDSQYFLGSLVLKKHKKEEGSTKYEEYDLLDGQQRLTTLFLNFFVEFLFLRILIKKVLAKISVCGYDVFMRDRIIKKLIADIEKHTLPVMSKKTKVPYTTLYRIANNQGDCRYRTWELLENYYSNKRGGGRTLTTI